MQNERQDTDAPENSKVMTSPSEAVTLAGLNWKIPPGSLAVPPTCMTV